MNRTLYFVINQDPTDDSAHALYTMRHLAALARMRPAGWTVELVCTSTAKPVVLPGVTVTTLPSLRRSKEGWGLHVNAVFHHAAWRYLSGRAAECDAVATASFPVLFEFLAARIQKRNGRPRLAYEIHQLECLSREASHEKCRQETYALGLADVLLTTTGPLEKIARSWHEDKPVTRMGLAASYEPVPARERGEVFRVGYFGSISPEQGIPWLASHWNRARERYPHLEIHVFGRARRGERLPESQPGFVVHPGVPSEEVPRRCESLDALVIPALDQGHRSAIAFTKVYDYVGLALPLIASDLPTIREVVRDEREALLFPPGDAEGFLRQLDRVMSDPDLAQRLRAACVSRALELSWDARARRWWEALLP